ncbi:hypothetical protein MRX96_012501 [Rhipicephalus microplus]
MAARSKSVEASPDANSAPSLAPSRGAGAPLRMLKRTVMLETVSKSVTERKESTKQVTDQATGVERRRDSHIESSTTEEVRSKRQEETGRVVRRHGDSRRIAADARHAVSDCDRGRRRSLGARRGAGGRVAQDLAQAPGRRRGKTSIRRAPVHKLEFTEEEPEYHRAELVQPPADLLLRAAASSSDQADDDDEVAEPPPSRFNLRRKDSIAVTKLRMLRQQEGEISEEDLPEEDEPPDLGTTSPDKKHPVFKPPTIISIVPEEDVSMVSESVDVTDGKRPPPTADDTKVVGGPPAADDSKVVEGQPHTVTESSTHVDKQVTSNEKQEVKTYPNETVTHVDADEVVKQTKSEVTTETTVLVPREASAGTIVATVVNDVSSNVKTPMDDHSKDSL